MKPIRFTEAEITAHASRAYEYFVRRPADPQFRMFMNAEPEPIHGTSTAFEDLTPVLEIKRPAAMTSSGLGEAVKCMASYWDIFNQICIGSTRLAGDR